MSSNASGSIRPFRKLLVANRSEIAIRVFRAASELGIRTVAVYSHEDRYALHRFKADEAYLIGKGMGPVQAYLSIDEMIRVARDVGADAVHPGYGFLSESPEFAEACAENGITFIGPSPEVMRGFGSKVSARALAERAKIPVMPATGPLPYDMDEAAALARQVGYPVMLKASWGGGGRGMRVVEDESMLAEQVAAGRREAKGAFGKDEVFLEKLVRRARHVEVQILGDHHGKVIHLFRARLHHAAPQSKGGRARARPLSQRGNPPGALSIRRAAWRNRRVPECRHRRIPDGRRDG